MRRLSTRLILGFLVIAAMGLAQLLGVNRGFWCECAPVSKMVEEASCVTAHCHPHLDHPDGCQDEEGAAAIESDHEQHPVSPMSPDHDHQHREIRESLQTTAVASVISVPAPAMYDLPPSMLMTWSVELKASALIQSGRSRKISDGSPPTPVLVARAMVMRV